MWCWEEARTNWFFFLILGGHSRWSAHFTVKFKLIGIKWELPTISAFKYWWAGWGQWQPNLLQPSENPGEGLLLKTLQISDLWAAGPRSSFKNTPKLCCYITWLLQNKNSRSKVDMAPAIKAKNAVMTWWGSPSSEHSCLTQSGQPRLCCNFRIKMEWREVSGRIQQGGTLARNNEGVRFCLMEMIRPGLLAFCRRLPSLLSRCWHRWKSLQVS